MVMLPDLRYVPRDLSVAVVNIGSGNELKWNYVSSLFYCTRAPPQTNRPWMWRTDIQSKVMQIR